MAKQIWPEGKSAGLTLCYDGGHKSHLDVLPLLESLKLNATFFVPPVKILEGIGTWKSAIPAGHEIGCHSLYQVSEHGALFLWNKAMVEEDLRLAKDLHEQILGCEVRSFALPGWSTFCSDGDYLETVQNQFVYVRTERRAANHPRKMDPGFLSSFSIDLPKDDLAGHLAVAIKQGHWMLLCIDEVPADHELLLRSLAMRQELWIAPIGVAGDWLRPKGRHVFVT